MAIASILEFGDSIPDLFEVAEDAAMNDLFLQRAVKALGDTVGLWLGQNSLISSNFVRNEVRFKYSGYYLSGAGNLFT